MAIAPFPPQNMFPPAEFVRFLNDITVPRAAVLVAPTIVPLFVVEVKVIAVSFPAVIVPMFDVEANVNVVDVPTSIKPVPTFVVEALNVALDPVFVRIVPAFVVEANVVCVLVVIDTMPPDRLNSWALNKTLSALPVMTSIVPSFVVVPL